MSTAGSPLLVLRREVSGDGMMNLYVLSIPDKPDELLLIGEVDQAVIIASGRQLGSFLRNNASMVFLDALVGAIRSGMERHVG